MQNFRWINKQGVESDLGFIVQFTGRFTAEYREGGRSFVVDVEDGGSSGDKSNILYSRSSLLRLIPSQNEQMRVEANFRAAMHFQGLVPVAYE